MRGVPVGNIVDVALAGSSSNEVAKSDRHVDDSIFEVEVLLEFNIFRQDVSHLNSILIVEVGLPVIV